MLNPFKNELLFRKHINKQLFFRKSFYIQKVFHIFVQKRLTSRVEQYTHCGSFSFIQIKNTSFGYLQQSVFVSPAVDIY